jgi:isoaspartyl peptidase/L-asparaginase-like protein (Ntn-hydrolase superfamily)
MKKAGRVGDSPLSGSGFYVDSEIGGARNSADGIMPIIGVQLIFLNFF